MSVTSEAQSRFSSLAGLARQGVETFVAAQNILMDLTAQENALLIGVVRERLKMPVFRPGPYIAGFADHSVAALTSAGKVLLDLAAAESSLMLDGVQEGIRLPMFADTVADIIRHRIDTFVEEQKRMLKNAADQTHAAAESYKDGQGLKIVAGLAQLARQNMEDFVEIEKKYLDRAAAEITKAADGTKESHKPARDKSKLAIHLAREGVEKWIDAQKRLLDVTIQEFDAALKARSEAVEEFEEQEPRTSVAEVTQKSVHNLVTAQKALMDLAIRPTKTDRVHETHTETPRRAHKRPAAKRAAR